MSKKKKSRFSTIIIVSFLSLLAIYILIKISSGVASSLHLVSQDRLNVAFYNKRPFILSFGRSDNVNYVINLNNDIELLVPGGYGRYKIGSLGKLARLEKNPNLVRLAFSSLISTSIDFYYTPKTAEVYDRLDGEEGEEFSKMAFLSTLFSSAHDSNASFFDKLYLSWLLLNHRKQDFVSLSPNLTLDDTGKYAFSETAFGKKVKGFFFHKSFREEGGEVKLYYGNYAAATTISRVLEGSGIRVVDLEPVEKSDSSCLVVIDIERENDYIKTVSFLEKLFNCTVKEGSVQGAGVAIYLGSTVEEVWE